MKLQWTLIFALLFALIIAVFSVVNVAPVPVDYVFGVAQFPLIMVILGSALAGGFVVGLFGTIRMVGQNRRIRALERELQALKEERTAAPEIMEPVPDPAAEPEPDPGTGSGTEPGPGTGSGAEPDAGTRGS